MESLARISNMLETARDLTLEAAQSASAAGRRREIIGAGSKISTIQETKKLLNSRMDREVLEGLKRVTEVRYAPSTSHEEDVRFAQGPDTSPLTSSPCLAAQIAQSS